MPPDYLHNHKEYKELIRAVSQQKGIAPDLVEKDYWIMHCLHGLSKQGYQFELKGGTSLSKGFGIVHRFSEDIDIRIEPAKNLNVFTGKNQNKTQHCESRKAFYDRLSADISISGIEEVVRDEVFDDKKYRSGGVRLKYSAINPVSGGVKDGILLEVGFDTVTPNRRVNISSWALDFAKANNVTFIDNEAKQVVCYEPAYTFVEKLQTIATKYRIQQETGDMPKNFMRHYYDVACLLKDESVQAFIETLEYKKHKKVRFPKQDYEIPMFENEAFLLSDKKNRALYQKSYESTSALYYQEQPAFEDLLLSINRELKRL